MDCERVGVAGLGLIGTSVAQGLAAGFAKTVVGFDPERRARSAASTSVTSTTKRLDDLRGADLIVLAAPPGKVPDLVAQIASWPSGGSTVTDVASVKGGIVAAAPASIKERFVPGHPMAGNESTGSAAARPDLFYGAHWVLCPFAETSDRSLQTVRSMVRHLRALPVVMDALDHDRHTALLSHLPHVLASALLVRALELEHREVTGGSWKDLTRVGGSNPSLWADILVANRAAILDEIDKTSAVVGEFRSAIESGDTARLSSLIERARGAK